MCSDKIDPCIAGEKREKCINGNVKTLFSIVSKNDDTELTSPLKGIFKDQDYPIYSRNDHLSLPVSSSVKRGFTLFVIDYVEDEDFI